MLQIRVHCTFAGPPLRHYRSLVTNALANQDEYNRLAQYPEIKDIGAKANQEERKKAYHEEVKQIKTVEEKLIKLNMPKYYGFKCSMLNDKKFPYNSLPLSQYACRTHFEQLDDLSPLFSKSVQEKCAPLKTRIISELEEAIAFEADCRRSQSGLDDVEKDRHSNSSLIQQLNRTILNALAAEHPHTANVEVDLEPRHEAFWFVGGIPPLTIVQKNREGRKSTKDRAKEPLDRPFQYIGSPYLALRHKNPLQPFREVNLEALNLGAEKVEIPEYKYDPRTLGYSTAYRHGTTVPGFWPGSPHEFGLLTYQSRDHFKLRSKIFGNSEVDWPEALQSQAIQSSFAWTFGQACYQGFSTFNDVTYPFTTQTIITDGQMWSFYAYQLNTTLLHSRNVDENPRYNMCWGSKELKLFETIDKETGKIVGLNEDVLTQLLHFYLNEPVELGGQNLKPYLGEFEQTAADIEDEHRRVFLESRYKHLVSNRPRHRLTPEIYAWEKIYKIDNNTKPMVPKRRFFELKQKPFNRRLDEHTPVYIPKAKRPDGPKSRKMWEKTYYP